VQHGQPGKNAFKVEPKRATGAGDCCWQTLSDILQASTQGKAFANAYASSYVRNIYAEPPTMKETFEILDSAGSIV